LGVALVAVNKCGECIWPSKGCVYAYKIHRLTHRDYGGVRSTRVEFNQLGFSV
jgi:hypothetical protein